MLKHLIKLYIPVVYHVQKTVLPMGLRLFKAHVHVPCTRHSYQGNTTTGIQSEFEIFQHKKFIVTK